MREEEKEKSLTGVSGKALITACLLFRSGKIKICIQENLALQEQLPSIIMNPE
ncbi:MAG: hypothetical protein NC123_19075 [Butyrivibrio sp.]|nr:hypothetical protein [Butyrivibrio sp.]